MKTDIKTQFAITRLTSNEIVNTKDYQKAVTAFERSASSSEKGRETIKNTYRYLDQKPTRAKIKYISPQIGHGLFAAEPIAPGQLIGEYTGIVRSIQQSQDQNNHYLMYLLPETLWWDMLSHGTTINKESLVIDARYKGNETRFINHSSTAPNLKLITAYSNGQFYKLFISTREIKKSEELRFDYQCSVKMFQ
jgi:SET domain-containing protein